MERAAARRSGVFVLALAVATGALLSPLAVASGSAGGCPPTSDRSRTIACVGAAHLLKPRADHWMYVAAKAERAIEPRATPLIVPTDPPRFERCIAQVRRKIPSLRDSSRAARRKRCAKLFRSLSSQVLDYLIRSAWYEAQAAVDGIVVSDAQVRREFEREKRQQFRTQADFRRFLKDSGYTVADLHFRVRMNLIYRRLLRRYPNPAALDKSVRGTYRPLTYCQRHYLVARLCGHAFAG
jgi:hypothetical protein